jgi:hypothetical protein
MDRRYLLDSNIFIHAKNELFLASPKSQMFVTCIPETHNEGGGRTPNFE